MRACRRAGARRSGRDRGRRSRCSCPVLHVRGAAEAGEDLAALRVVPVAERRRDRSRLSGPRAAAQHLERARRRSPASTPDRGRPRSPGRRRTRSPSIPTRRPASAARRSRSHRPRKPRRARIRTRAGRGWRRPRHRPSRRPPSPTPPRWAGACRPSVQTRRPRTRRRGTRAAQGPARPTRRTIARATRRPRAASTPGRRRSPPGARPNPPGSTAQRRSYPPSAMKSQKAPFVTGARSMRNASTSRTCCGRSLS